MKLTTVSLTIALLAADELFSHAAALPPSHPNFDLLNEFGGHFRCPHAQEWLAKGPQRAARDLGLPESGEEAHRRALQQQQQQGGGGPPPGVFGGDGGPPASIFGGGDGGGPPPGAGDVNCMIAPGTIGAGHQAGFSSGYDPACPGTPAEGSPYMWPMAWSAGVEAKSMAFGSDEVVYQSVGQVYYRLDKNWKRQDWFRQRGVQRSVGQAPCAPENKVGDLACRRDTDQRTTMIHRGSKMYFISWKNNTEGDAPENIEKCQWLDLQIVGNIRPDWYMDARGDSTDVQYLGDQHVFYNNQPRLMKQWRKQDFAQQYFTMSVLANTDQDDGIHWPMILNVPGEGFGDDFLQVYSNHTVLTDKDNDLFLLDQALEAAGGECLQRAGGGEAPGPLAEPIPSNLEVDPNAWFSNEFTFSPVWKPSQQEEDKDMDDGFGADPDRGITKAGQVTVESCYDSSTSNVELTVTYSNVVAAEDDENVVELPWMALGYRQTEECLMTPRGGGNSEIILISSSSLVQETNEVGVEIPTAGFGLLSPAAKRFDSNAVSSVYEGLVPLAEVSGFSNVRLSFPASTAVLPPAVDKRSFSLTRDGTVQLTFRQSMRSRPEVMNLMYAIGNSPELGYHSSRECFQVTEFPQCPPIIAEEGEMNEEPLDVNTNDSKGLIGSSAQPFFSSFVIVLNLGLVVIVGALL